MRYITIVYDETLAAAGNPIDLFSYLENEFNNHRIQVSISEFVTQAAVQRAVAEWD